MHAIKAQNMQALLRDAVHSRYPELILSPSEIRLGEPMCPGNDGAVVHRGTLRGSDCSIKRVPLSITSREQLDRLQDALAKLSADSSFVNLYGLCFEDGQCMILSEWMQYNLSDVIYGKELHNLSLLKRRQLALQIVRMIRALHEQGIVHGSLKPQNILVDAGIDEVKVCAFDIFRLDGDHPPSHEKSDVFYAAPEQLRGEPSTMESDVYSLGLILLELETGQRVWIELNDDTWRLSDLVQADKRPEQLNQVEGETHELIDQCLRRDPTARPSIDQVEELVSRLLENTQLEGERRSSTTFIPIPFRPTKDAFESFPGTPAESGRLFHEALEVMEQEGKIAIGGPADNAAVGGVTDSFEWQALPPSRTASPVDIAPPPADTEMKLPFSHMQPAGVGEDARHPPIWDDITVLTEEEKKRLRNPIQHWTSSPCHRVYIRSLGRWGYLAGKEWGPAGYNRWTGRLGVWVDDLMHLFDPSDLVDSGDPCNAPWFRSSVKVCHVPIACEVMRQVLAKPVPGLGGLTTFMDVFRELWSRGIFALIVGGAVRDTVQGQSSIKDIDVTFDCSAEEFVHVAKEMGWPVTTLTTRGLVQLGDISNPLFLEGRMLGGWNSDIHPVGTQFRAASCDMALDVVCRDYTCNTLYYDPINETVIDPTGIGISDARRKLLRIPVDEPHWDEWFEGNPFKMARYWKMRARGFRPYNEHFRQWLLQKARTNFGTHRFLQQGWCLKYLVRAIGRKEWANIRAAVTEDLGHEFCDAYWAPL